MDTHIADAIAAFRELAQTRARLRQEITDAEAHVKALENEYRQVHDAYYQAKRHLVEAVGGVPLPEDG